MSFPLDTRFFTTVRAHRDALDGKGDLARFLILNQNWPGDAGWDSTSLPAWLTLNGAPEKVQRAARDAVDHWLRRGRDV